MMLLTKAIRAKLRANQEATDASESSVSHTPVVKFFTPWGSATWLFTELYADGDTLFGLCDCGHGTPELGYASLAEITALRGPFGLGIERDRHWTADKTLSEYATEASSQGRINA